MKFRSADRKKEKNQHEIKKILSMGSDVKEKIREIFKYFQNLKTSNKTFAFHAYKNFLAMPESKSLMNYRYISQTNAIADVISYGNKTDTLEDIITWVTITLDYFKDEINTFTTKRDLFNKHLLLSNYDSAEKLLNEIENETGKSLWSISSRLNLLYFKNDIQEYNILAKEYISISDDYSRSIISYEAIRCNKSISPERYLFSIGKMIEEFRLAGNDAAEEALSYRHNFDPSLPYSKIEYIYKSTYEQRIVDVYNSFLKIISYCLTKRINISCCQENIEHLSTIINDRSLKVLVANIKDKTPLVINDHLQERYDEIISCYLKEDFDHVIVYSEILLKSTPDFTVCYIPYIKSLIAKNTNSNLTGLIEDLISTIQSIYCGKQFYAALEKLRKIDLVLNHNIWSQVFSCVLAEFDGYDSKQIPLKFNFSDNICLYRNVMSLSGKNKEFFERSDIPEWRKNKFLAELNYFEGDYNESFNKFNAIEKKTPYIRSKLIQCQYHLNLIDDAVADISKCLLSGQNPRSLPLVLIAKEINKKALYSDDNQKLFFQSVALHYYKENFGSDFTQTLSNICENYLENLNLLTLDDIKHGKNIENFMLDNILKLEVIDGMSNIFNSDLDVLMCRLNINRWILSNKSNYTSQQINQASAELKDIFYKTVVEVCSHEAGEGKLYVDRNGLKNKIINEITKHFDDLLTEHDREIDFTIHENIIFMKDVDVNIISSDKYFVNKILEILFIIYNSYTVDKIYGLDQSLNMGIRHGGIINLLWAPLKENNISATKIKERFLPNPTWRTYFGYYTDNVLDKIDVALVKFNTNINKIITEAKNKVNIDTGEFGFEDKWFLYSPDLDLQSKIVKNFDSYTPESLIDDVIMHLDLHTEKCMSDIIDNHIPKLKDEIMDEIENLENELDRNNINFVNLKRSISHSKSELKASIEILEKWFAWLGESKTNFDMRAVIGKAISAVEQFHTWMDIKLDSKVNSHSLLKGRFFTDIVMVLTLMFENTVKHSNLKEDCNIKVKVSESDDLFTIVVINDIGKEHNEEDLNRINKINNDLANNNIDNSMKDNGSGLYKIKKILTHNLKTENHVFAKSEKNKFTVTVSFKKSLEILSIE